ncbi:DUF3925 family protein [Pseudogracilibacillus auburnensis]|nr:DUF3925 family protein [Pseudogracilibacillus auburnensis]
MNSFIFLFNMLMLENCQAGWSLDVNGLLLSKQFIQSQLEHCIFIPLHSAKDFYPFHSAKG